MEEVQPVTGDLTCDIAVIGAGSAGLASAVSAAEAGAKNIIVLEKTEKPGGNSLHIGCIFAVNSPLQKRMGVNPSEAMAFHDKMAHCNWRVNARLIRDTIRISGDVIGRLENKGVLFKHMMVPMFRDDSPQVAHDVSIGQFGATGRAVINALSKDCQKNGINILCNTSSPSMSGSLRSSRTRSGIIWPTFSMAS